MRQDPFSPRTLGTLPLVFASNDKAYGDFIRSELLKLFPGTDLGKLDAFCGVKIIHSDDGLKLSLQHYLDNFFSLFNIKTTIY